MNKSDKIFVAGHNGMVGSAIMRRLKLEGFNNFVLRTSKELDLRNQKDVLNFFNKHKPDHVFLAAAKVGGIVANNSYRADFLFDNLLIEANVINSSYEIGVKKLQFMGSSCIYPKLAAQPLKEEYLLSGKLEPTNEPYAIAKIAGIKLCDAYRDQYGCNYHSIMPTNLYGPNDNYDLDKSHVLPAMIRKFHLAKLWENNDSAGLKSDLVKYLNQTKGFEEFLNDKGIFNTDKGVEVSLWGSGSPMREFLHVDDLAEASVLLMNNDFSGSFINIGTGVDLSIKSLALKVKEIVRFKGEIKWDKSKPEGTPKKLMDISKISEIGWKPKINLEEGIKKVYQDYLTYAS